MKLWKILIISLALYGCEKEGFAQEPQKELRAEVIIENPVFKVWYSEIKEQPLKLTFSYLNCALQNQYLNRGEWRLLEEQERDWDDESNLTVTVELVFDEGHEVLPTGGHIPTDMIKHIYFEKTGSYRCFEFENVKPEKGWEEHEVTHSH